MSNDTEKLTGKIYDDLIQPSAKAIGETVALIPRAIKSALLPLEKWITNREYACKDIRRLLEAKMSNVAAENIVSPEPYIAVPAIQAISYCIDSEQLRNMFANLLAVAMNSTIRDKAHPAFVEIIKQLSPLDAQILKGVFERDGIELVKIRYQKKVPGCHLSDLPSLQRACIPNISPVGETILTHYTLFENLDALPDTVAASISNLERLGLIFTSYDSFKDGSESFYYELENSSHVKALIKKYPDTEVCEIILILGYCAPTPFGIQFSEVCLTD